MLLSRFRWLLLVVSHSSPPNHYMGTTSEYLLSNMYILTFSTQGSYSHSRSKVIHKESPRRNQLLHHDCTRHALLSWKVLSIHSIKKSVRWTVKLLYFNIAVCSISMLLVYFCYVNRIGSCEESVLISELRVFAKKSRQSKLSRIFSRDSKWVGRLSSLSWVSV